MSDSAEPSGLSPAKARGWRILCSPFLRPTTHLFPLLLALLFLPFRFCCCCSSVLSSFPAHALGRSLFFSSDALPPTP